MTLMWLSLRTLEFFRYSNVVLRFVHQKPILSITLNSAVFLVVDSLNDVRKTKQGLSTFCLPGKLDWWEEQMGRSLFQGKLEQLPISFMGDGVWHSDLWREKSFCMVLKGWDGRNNWDWFSASTSVLTQSLKFSCWFMVCSLEELIGKVSI